MSHPITTSVKPPQVLAAPLNSITPVTKDCPVEVFRWGGNQDHHIADVSHAHAFDEILIFNKGGGKHFIDGIWHEVQDASVHFIRVGAEHLLMRSATADGGTVLFLRDYLAHEPQLPFKQLFFFETQTVLNLSPIAFTELWLIYEQMLKESNKEHHFYRKQVVLSWLNAFLVKIAEYYRTLYPDALGDRITVHPLAGAFQNLVEEHFQEQKSVEFYARSLFVTPKYLHEISRKHLGKCPQDLIADHTVHMAVSRLQKGTDSVKKIASELGFSDPAYFSRFFKKHTGKSPVEWQVMQQV
ncbi:MAG: helix-turn-helix domain-containing protein [Saprospiraceae bacterium]